MNYISYCLYFAWKCNLLDMHWILSAFITVKSLVWLLLDIVLVLLPKIQECLNFLTNKLFEVTLHTFVCIIYWPKFLLWISFQHSVEHIVKMIKLLILWNFLNIVLFLFQLKEYSQKAVEILRAQNHILTNHPNSNIYKYVYTNILSFNMVNQISSSGHHLQKTVTFLYSLLQHSFRFSWVWWLLPGEWPLLGVQQSRSSFLSMCNTTSFNGHKL